MLKLVILSLFVPSILCNLAIQPHLANFLDVSPLSQPHPCNNFSKEFETNQRGCSWFWQCRDEAGVLKDEPIEGSCPDNLHFNVASQSCGYADGSCRIDDNLFLDTPTECTANRMDLIPHQFDCNQYYLCWRNYTELRTCPEDEHFSYFQNGCTRKEIADCRVEHNYCRRMEIDNVKARGSPYSCETYHVCSECNNRLSLIELQCENGTHQFSEKFGHCDVAANVTCSIDPAPPGIPEGLAPAEPLSIQCTREDIAQGLVAHPENQQYFFNCASGRSRLHKCPAGSNFNTDLGECLEIFLDPFNSVADAR